jgi:hypothetical protein
MTPMTDVAEPTTSRQIISALAEMYSRHGFRQLAVPARTLLGLGDRRQLESALAALLDSGDIVPIGNNGVALHPSARIALLSRAVLGQWMDKLSRETGHTLGLYRDAITTELRDLVAWASRTTLPPELAERAAELAGVLATRDLDPRAMDIVSRHGGTPYTRLAALATAAPGSCPSLDQLMLLMRNAVSTITAAD